MATSSDRLKKELKEEFTMAGCLSLWSELYDVDIMTYSEVLNDCFRRADGMLAGDKSDTAAMKAFVKMVGEWS